MANASLPELSASSLPKAAPRLSSSLATFWIWPNLFSLDAPFIALLWQEVFARSLHNVLTSRARLALGLAVWIIYITDRALDSFEPSTFPTARHLFYRSHRTAAFAAASIALCVEAIVSQSLAPGLFVAGTAIALIVTVYLLTVHVRQNWKRRWLPKEAIVALLFAAGTILATFLKIEERRSVIVPGLLFALLCLLNCVAIEYREWQHFRPGGLAPSDPLPVSLWTAWLASNLQPVAAALALTALCFALIAGHGVVYGSLAVSALALVWFDREHHRMPVDVMRALADLPLALPVIFLVLVTRP